MRLEQDEKQFYPRMKLPYIYPQSRLVIVEGGSWDGAQPEDRPPPDCEQHSAPL